MPQSPTGESRSLDPRSPEAQFGMRLRKAREQRGISLREMARRLSRAHSNLWDYERGHRLATPDVVAEYESELRMPAGELQTPLEEARLEIFGADRHRRRPFRPPAPQFREKAPVVPPQLGHLPAAWTMPRPGGPFIGRDRESASVRAWLDEAEAGDPRIVVVRGPAGIGKSTLLAHVLAGLAPDRWTVLRASCLQGAPIAYLPVATALSPLLNAQDRHADPTTPGGLLELLVGEPDLSADGGSAAGMASVLSLDRRHLSLFFAATKVVLDAAIQRPVILALEDLHWADGSTLGLLEHLATIATQESTLTPTPLAVVLTTRAVTTEEPAWRVLQRLSRESTFRELTLTGLDDFEVTELVTELGQARPSPRLLRSVSVASQGNPLLVRSLIDRLITDGRIAVRDRMLGGEDGDLPVDALDLDAELAARLERIDPACLEIMTRAAVLGDGGSLVALQAVTAAPDIEFDRMLVSLAEARLLYEAGDTYRFDHPQLRVVLYASLPRGAADGFTSRSLPALRPSSPTTAAMSSLSPTTSTWPVRWPHPRGLPNTPERRPSRRGTWPPGLMPEGIATFASRPTRVEPRTPTCCGAPVFLTFATTTTNAQMGGWPRRWPPPRRPGIPEHWVAPPSP